LHYISGIFALPVKCNYPFKRLLRVGAALQHAVFATTKKQIAGGRWPTAALSVYCVMRVSVKYVWILLN